MAYTTIDDGSVYFQTTLYTGNAGALNIVNGGNSDLQPDLVWLKDRGATNSHRIVDSSRGVQKALRSNSADTEGTDTGLVTAFNSDGFSHNSTDTAWNGSGDTYIAWQWKANGGTRTTFTESGVNPGGGYQVNTTAGFSIVDYTGTGGNGTVAHGLGAVPHVMLFKCRSVGYHWIMYHYKNTSAPETDGIKLDETGATGDYIFYFQDTAPTSSVFTLGTSSPGDSGFNDDGATNIAYLWTEIQGFSKFGGYEGNNNSDGPFIYTGFKPAYFLVKNIDATSAWRIYSNKISNQNGFNDLDRLFYANTNEAESGTGHVVDFLSNGIKIRGDNEDVNDANTYIYMAFAEHPFVSSEGVPVTAR